MTFVGTRLMLLAASLCVVFSFTGTTTGVSRLQINPTHPSLLHATVAPPTSSTKEEETSGNNAADTPVVTSASSSSSSKAASSFDAFDYNSCWYPVIWARDLRINRPTRVTVFDTDYVLARLENNDEVICMVDRCPHKSASLSEGRVTSSGYFQCAYHGWSFDGKDGSCVEIPQVAAASHDAKISARACGTAVSAMIVQGMVWIFPGGNLEKALQAPAPPVIPEMDMDGYSTVREIRDFPVDWTILLENIMDPDHGLFAHQAQPFDLYSASKECPQGIEEELTNNGKSWKITSRVDAVGKLTVFDKERRGESVDKPDGKNVPTATTTFTAPSHVAMGRRDKDTGDSKFLTAFWICPVGTGRSRFMATATGKIPFLPPRWFMHINVNNFVDQDTQLLATQQKYVLGAEAEALKQMTKDGQDPTNQPTHVRKNLFVYRSPTERLGVRVGALWDATLNRVPNRVATLLDMESSGAFRAQPLREFVLDRNVQHTQICPDSQDTVQNCKRIERTSAAVAIFVAATKAWALMALSAATGTPTWATRLNKILKPTVMGWTLGLSAIASWLAKKIRGEFSFKYTERLRNRDMDKIPNGWSDKHA